MTKYDAVRELAKVIREIAPAQQERALNCILRASCKGKTPAEIVDAVERAGFERAPRLAVGRPVLMREYEITDREQEFSLLTETAVPAAVDREECNVGA